MALCTSGPGGHQVSPTTPREDLVADAASIANVIIRPRAIISTFIFKRACPPHAQHPSVKKACEAAKVMKGWERRLEYCLSMVRLTRQRYDRRPLDPMTGKGQYVSPSYSLAEMYSTCSLEAICDCVRDAMFLVATVPYEKHHDERTTRGRSTAFPFWHTISQHPMRSIVLHTFNLTR